MVDWTIFDHTKDSQPKHDYTLQKKTDAGNNPLGLALMMKRIVSKVVLRILPSRRISIAGRKLRNIILPKNRVLQVFATRKLLAWFSPCIELDENYHKMNERCVVNRENRLRQMKIKSLENYWPLLKKYFYFGWNPIYQCVELLFLFLTKYQIGCFTIRLLKDYAKQ